MTASLIPEDRWINWNLKQYADGTIGIFASGTDRKLYESSTSVEKGYRVDSITPSSESEYSRWSLHYLGNNAFRIQCKEGGRYLFESYSEVSRGFELHCISGIEEDKYSKWCKWFFV